MFILDSDADVVWYSSAPASASRARMDWEGHSMWVAAANRPRGDGQVWRVSMDGLELEQDIDGLGDVHHDFTVTPTGSVVAISYTDDCDAIIEREADGQVTTMVESVAQLYEPKPGSSGETECHANAITRQPDDTFIVSDRNASLFVRFNRDAELIWQFGGEDPKDPARFIAGSWNVAHGHQLLDDGNLLFFNNSGDGADEGSRLLEYSLDEQAMTATLVWSFSDETQSPILGDVQRLTNGNTLGVYSTVGVVVEVAPDGQVVRRIVSPQGAFGYAMHRDSLYGPPPR
jgi:hypothetical protein